MGDVTTVEMMRGLYDYHHWANRRLFDVAVALGEDVAVRDLGKQFSFPTIKAMFTHIYGADFLWFQCWKGITPVQRRRDEEFPTLAALRAPWDELEKDIPGLGLLAVTSPDLLHRGFLVVVEPDDFLFARGKRLDGRANAILGF